jgi:cytochrome P450 family 6
MLGIMLEIVFLSWLPFALFLAYLIYWYSTSTFNYWKEKGIPYVKPTPGFGNTRKMFFKTSFAEQFKAFYDEFDGKPFCGVFQFRSPILVVRDPDIIRLVLVKDFSYFQVIFLFLILCRIMIGYFYFYSIHKYLATTV